jgi:hypothetical protein
MQLTVLLLTAIGTLDAAAPMAECHMIVFAGSRSPLRPKYSHTFAVFTRQTPDQGAVRLGSVRELGRRTEAERVRRRQGGRSRRIRCDSSMQADAGGGERSRLNPERVFGQSLDMVCLSWIGSDADWGLFDGPQPGRNLTLEQTLERCIQRDQQITMWGPYRIDPVLYDRAEAQMQRLERGEICWQALDKKSRVEGLAANCFHVIGDLNREDGRLKTGWAHGVSASRKVVLHLQRFILDDCPADSALPALLRLHCYPIRRERIGLLSPKGGVRTVPSPCGGVR